MDLTQAVAKHVEWKTKLRAAIAKKEQLDEKTISADNCCDLGKWLHGAAKPSVGTLPAYKDTVLKHAAFHKEAGKVASAINAKKFTEAEAMLGNGTAYASASTAVGIAIANLKKEAGM
ncbi:CZB domain-containing protein [Undibacterium fentianense]|uniref:CZB domain-containing protein n=1 Tax=Undibacterium fentianense TaxID=2828728 RepID=A0A941E472_9BURK|nr:CZB domain-containing protein [Undibacterium fentianense]MBR7800872.1 CZB domain-containing protein [Undibacterium fentianense]